MKKQMKLSDYVVEFLVSIGVKKVFAFTGGASVHLIDSLSKRKGIQYICNQHEQAGAMAADGYSRVTGNIGVALSTSGPGATNLLTGVCCAFYDSVPALFITGQVSTFRFGRSLGVRQLGFQETEVVDIFSPITKYAVRIDDPRRIRFELEKANYIAREGRPGPVLVDIPDNLQRAEIEPSKLIAFVPPPQKIEDEVLNSQINECLALIKAAKRPVLVLGWGVRLAKAEKHLLQLVKKLQFPVLPTWAMVDFLPAQHPLLVGTFGTHGTRYGNFALQNSDLVLGIGARFDSKAASPMNTLARGAKKIVVDIDDNELKKFSSLGVQLDVAVHSDAQRFCGLLNNRLKHRLSGFGDWVEKITSWKEKYPICPPEYFQEKEVNPYVFFKNLSWYASPGDYFVLDTGCTLAWMMQAFEPKKNQRVFHDFNNTAMGYALPASIGVALGKGKKVICISGDGSMQMNIQELITVKKHRLPIKIFLLDNQGHGMIKQTQDQWLDSRYEGSSIDGGLAFPDFLKVAKAYGFKTTSISCSKNMKKAIVQVLDGDEPFFCLVKISPEHRVLPQVKYGRPIEDGEPLLERKEFLENMIIPAMDICLKTI